jgi:hypothetical protein
VTFGQKKSIKTKSIFDPLPGNFRDFPDFVLSLNLAAAEVIDREGREKERQERASRMALTDWPIDLLGGQRHGNGDFADLYKTILETEAPVVSTPLCGDDHSLDYYAGGYPNLPKCLNRLVRAENGGAL